MPRLFEKRLRFERAPRILQGTLHPQKYWSAPPAGTENSEAYLTRRPKLFLPVRVGKKSLYYRPGGFVLCERSSGAVRFCVEADADGSMPVEQMAGLLAMHCLVRGQAPEDFEVLVVTQNSLLPAVAERAEQLLAAGRAIGPGVKISPREQEVLDGVLHKLANKQIAAHLNVSERTVKFHVSSLLAKFGVTDRVALTQEVSLNCRLPDANAGKTPPQTLFGFLVRSPKGGAQEALAPEPSGPPIGTSRSRRSVLPVVPRERFAT